MSFPQNHSEFDESKNGSDFSGSQARRRTDYVKDKCSPKGSKISQNSEHVQPRESYSSEDQELWQRIFAIADIPEGVYEPQDPDIVKEEGSLGIEHHEYPASLEENSISEINQDTNKGSKIHQGNSPTNTANILDRRLYKPNDDKSGTKPISEQEAKLLKDQESAWEALRESGLITGGDSHLLDDDLFADLHNDPDYFEDDTNNTENLGRINSERSKTPSDATAKLALDLALEEQVQNIANQILSRAPEHQVQPSLDRVRYALDLLGNPQDSYRVVHITGTNGKTTTTRAIEVLIRESGIRTGRFTSPHLHTLRERIAIDGQPISAQAFIETWNDVYPYIQMADEYSQNHGGPILSFFEVLTVMAFAAFADAPIDVAVVEVGMGGIWDATNVVKSQVAVFTPVALDHQHWLGDSLSDIAQTKAGIIKPNSQVVSAKQLPEVADIITRTCEEKHVGIQQVGTNAGVLSTEFAVGGQIVTLQTPVATYQDVYLPLHGYFQAENLTLAIMAVEAFFGFNALDGLLVEKAIGTLKSPGRIEVLRSSPQVIADAAHNPHGVMATLENLENSFGLTHLVGVIGVMADKDVETMLTLLEPVLTHLVVTQLDSPRALNITEIYDLAVNIFGSERVFSCEKLEDAVETAVNLAESDPEEFSENRGVIIIGSVVLAAKAREIFGKSASFLA